MEPTDVELDLIESGEDISCKLVDGKCPKERYMSKKCPMNIMPDGYKCCCVEKE